MQSKLVAESAGRRTFVLILDPGEEAFQTISDFAVAQQIGGGSLTALGAFSTAVVGLFDLAAKTYRKIPVAQQSELLSAVGDIAIDDRGKSSLHVRHGQQPRPSPARNLILQANQAVYGTMEEEIRWYKGPPSLAVTKHWNYEDQGKDFAGGYCFMSDGPLPLIFAGIVSGERGLW
ncbi:MAG TPA: DUF296 domain-containing protein, partial [Pirellulales bacterium]|nr:DUF296 domain-containing protein [Pirellulales bacterium]